MDQIHSLITERTNNIIPLRGARSVIGVTIPRIIPVRVDLAVVAIRVHVRHVAGTLVVERNMWTL